MKSCMKSWTMLWEKFKIRYHLDEEIQEIKIFVEMKNYNNFSEFVPTKSPRFDSIPGSGGMNYEDTLLPLLEKYDFYKDVCCKVVDIFLKLSSETQILFNQVFVENVPLNRIRILTNNPFIYEEILVIYASFDDGLIGHDVIGEEFEALKQKYLNQIKNLKDSILDKKEISKYPILEKLSQADHCGNKTRKIQLEVLRILFEEKKLEDYDFRLFASMKCGGRKLIKDIERGRL